jgi:aspartate carbamoyltransferase catalytic subunit
MKKMAYASLEAGGKLARKTPSDLTRKARTGQLKHLLSTRTLDTDTVDDFCQLAEAYEVGVATPLRFGGKTVALLFFQPSTRTRIGFEVATVALGSHSIGMEDMSASRSNVRTGESLEDCAAVISRLCDAIVVRHHEDGAAVRMASKSQTPVINAGDAGMSIPPRLSSPFPDID